MVSSEKPVVYTGPDRRSKDIEMQALREEVNDLKAEVSELRKDIAGLIEAWNTAQGVTKFVKWLSTFITGAGIIYALWKR
jgi:archaellum component FlaC